MRIKVQKYGGSSLAGTRRLRRVARRVAESHRDGFGTAVVVSAMGGTTDELLGLARDVSTDPCNRELDMLLSSGERVSTALLALAIQDLGVEAISLTGQQSGIVTSDRHFNAEIRDVKPKRVMAELEAGKVVVVAGFQGVSPKGETTTLGRGGSDTSAVVLSAALDAECCEIYSDVDGVFTADPRIVEDARPLEVLSYEEMLELARHGASVLNPSAVEHARDLSVILRAASTFSDAPGTLIRAAPPEGRRRRGVKGVACHDELIRVSMSPCDELEREVLEASGGPDVYLEDVGEQGGRREVFVRSETVAGGEALSDTLEKEFGPRVEVETDVGSVSAVGWQAGAVDAARTGMRRVSRKLRLTGDRYIASEHAQTLLLKSGLVAGAARLLHGELLEPAVTAGGGAA